MEAPPVSTKAVMDIAVALRRLNGKEALLAGMAGLFLEDAPQVLEQLQVAIQTNSSAQIVRYAHNLRGLAAPFEATPVMDLTSQIERCGSGGSTTPLEGLIRELNSEMQRLSDALTELRSRSDAQRRSPPHPK